ncbi:unnamed protein product [Effrenium voratum]|nr:unnamed protein product [Effrenium voratum]
MQSGMTDADAGSDLALARALAEEVGRHGGQLKANFVPALRPDLRKRLGDEKLLQFLRRFPELLEVRDHHGGHLLCAAAPAQPVTALRVGSAPGATRPGRHICERAVHALRQLERELLLRLEGATSVQVGWLLYNGKVRRKVGAVVQFHPVTELLVRTETEMQAGTGCPGTAQARTYAGYLLQFLGDRPEQFRLERGRRPDTTCAYNDDGCSCQFRVSLLPGAQEEADEGDEALAALVAQKVQQMSYNTGSHKVPLVRLGRDRELKEALQGQQLLQFLGRKAAQAKMRLETGCALLVSLRVPIPMPTSAPAVRPQVGRRQSAPATTDVLGEAPGLAVVLKRPGVTSEAELAALQAHFQQRGLDRQVISVSRLDKDTSGLLVAATSQEGAECLTQQFKEHQVFKRYLALCTGSIEPLRGEVDAKLYISGFSEKYRAYVSPKGKPSTTGYEVLAKLRRQAVCVAPSDELSQPLERYVRQHCPGEEYSLLACYPRTGRTHQIRAHMEFKGHPLVSDANYNPRGQARRHFAWCPRLWLHCQQMCLLDLEGRRHDFRAPLPSDLLAVLAGCQDVGGSCLGADDARSCIYSAEEELIFVRDHLGPALRRHHEDVKILVWDHNRDGMLERASVIYDDSIAADLVWGVAYHWYGDPRFETWPPRTEVPFADRQQGGTVPELRGCAGFENVRQLADLRPDKHILFTEGCQELGGRPLSSVMGDWKLGERYSMNIIADVNAGCEGWIDWNLCLDEEGGPNHVGNTCVAPVICDTRTDKVLYQPSFWHLGHFSRYIRPGARRVLCSTTRDALEVTAFANPDGGLVVVVLNQSEESIGFWLKVRHSGETRAVVLESPRRSIQTLLVEDGKKEGWFSKLARTLPSTIQLGLSNAWYAVAPKQPYQRLP